MLNLLSLNTRYWNPQIHRITLAIAFCGTLLVGVGPPLWRGTLDDPCRNYDSWQYESIAFSLVRGGGFSNWFDEAFAAPYFEHGSDERYEQFRAYAQTPEPTTLRPPLWPTIIFPWGSNSMPFEEFPVLKSEPWPWAVDFQIRKDCTCSSKKMLPWASTAGASLCTWIATATRREHRFPWPWTKRYALERFAAATRSSCPASERG